MSWTLQTADVQTFEQNTLAVVVVQCRFHPILKIADRLADFQEKVRPRFPGYQLVDSQFIEIGPSGVQTRNEIAHQFLAAPGEPSIAALSTSSISVEYNDHKTRKTLLEDTATLMEALQSVYKPVVPLRLGLRYVNVIRRKAISDALKRDIAWTELLAPNFASVPGKLAPLDSTNFSVEVVSPCERGRMTVRYGLVPHGDDQEFRLDTDRYIEGSFSLDEIGSLLETFSVDIFQVFITAAGPALLEWMHTKEVAS